MPNLPSTFFQPPTVNDTFYIEDIDNFIELVQARPALYNKNIKEYAELNVKKKLWEQICRAIYAFWDNLDAGMKCEGIIRVQKKWMNLRSCFCRELKWQQRVKSGLASSKRRRYIHFEKLVFLKNILNNTEVNDTEDNESESNDNEANNADDNEVDENDDDSNIESDEDESRSGDISTKKYRPATMKRRLSGSPEGKLETKPHFEEVEINSLQAINDDDTYFVLSLVPQIKSLTDDEKFDAKIGMLRVIQDIKRKKAK